MSSAKSFFSYGYYLNNRLDVLQANGIVPTPVGTKRKAVDEPKEEAFSDEVSEGSTQVRYQLPISFAPLTITHSKRLAMSNQSRPVQARKMRSE